MNTLFTPQLLAYSLLASVVALLGGVLFLYVPRLSKWLEKYGVSFAAGAMIATSLIALLPEATHVSGSSAFTVFTLAFLGAYIFEKFCVALHHHGSQEHGHSHDDEHAGTVKSSVPLVLFGDSLHNFIDGVTIATAYLIQPQLALVTAISTFLHEVPHEIGDFSILRKAGYSNMRIIGVNVISALATVTGALLVTTIPLSETVLGYLLAIAAGIFFYLGAVDFLPHAFEAGSKCCGPSKYGGPAVVVLGAVIMIAFFTLAPHSHEHKLEHGHEEVLEENYLDEVHEF